MEAYNGIDNGKPNLRKKHFDLFRPVSVKPDGNRIQSANWCVRFQHQGKRTCRSLGTADYRLANQRAKQLVVTVRQKGWANVTILPTSHGTLPIDDLLERYQSAAVSRGLRPRSIEHATGDLRRIARETSTHRLGELTPDRLQDWIRECGLKPITLRAVLKNAASVFARANLQSMGLAEVQNPFKQLVRPKVDREPFHSPPRDWITKLMRRGVEELEGDTRLAFVLALGTGLRWGEIISLKWEDVQAGGVRVPAAKAKGRRARVVPMGKKVQGVLTKARGHELVISGDAKEIHEKLCAWLRVQGVKDAKPVHYLRKCFGSMAVADHGIFLASKLLGHSSINLTASTYAGQVDQLPAVSF
jgi:integrase